MSKSLHNYIGIDESPNEMFGKIMSISDELMWRYFELLTDATVNDLNTLKFKAEAGDENPRDLKVTLAKQIIKDFHGWEAAEAASDEFERRFVKKEVPDEIDERTIAAGPPRLADLIVQTGLAASKGEARRLIEQGGVKVDQEKISDIAKTIEITKPVLIQCGRRKFAKVHYGG